MRERKREGGREIEHTPFSMESWLSPPDWKSYSATNRLGSSAVVPDCSRFSREFHLAINGLSAWNVPDMPVVGMNCCEGGGSKTARENLTGSA